MDWEDVTGGVTGVPEYTARAGEWFGRAGAPFSAEWLSRSDRREAGITFSSGGGTSLRWQIANLPDAFY